MQALIIAAEADIEQKFLLKDIGDELESLQKIVEGSIDIMTINIAGNDYDLIFNSEGKLIELPMNLALFNGEELFDIIMGNIIIAKADEEGERIALTNEDLTVIMKYFNKKGYVVIQNIIMPYYVFNEQ